MHFISLTSFVRLLMMCKSHITQYEIEYNAKYGALIEFTDPVTHSCVYSFHDYVLSMDFSIVRHSLF